MPNSFLLTPWVTIQSANATPIYQNESEWLDLEAFTDVCFYEQHNQVVGSPTLAIETSPSRDPDLFRVLSGATATLSTATPKNTWLVRYATAAEPLARFVRWVFTGPAAAAGSATFRIWVSANSQGGFVAPFPRMVSSNGMRER